MLLVGKEEKKIFKNETFRVKKAQTQHTLGANDAASFVLMLVFSVNICLPSTSNITSHCVASAAEGFC